MNAIEFKMIPPHQDSYKIVKGRTKSIIKCLRNIIEARYCNN